MAHLSLVFEALDERQEEGSLEAPFVQLIWVPAPGKEIKFGLCVKEV